MIESVTDLCCKYPTDKHRVGNNRRFPHSYMYDKIFLPYKEKPIKFLEIGILYGGSLKVWEEYFPNAKVFAIDLKPIEKLELHVEPTRTKIDSVDQSDAEALKEYAEKNGPFDIIVDDGSHFCSHQILSFETLWSYVNVGGLYVIEDTSTSIPGRWKYDQYIDTEVTCMEYFHNLVDVACMARGSSKKYINPLHREVYAITFKADMIVVSKEIPWF